MKIKNFIWYMGLWLYPITACLCAFICMELERYITISSLVRLLFIFVLPLFPPLAITLINWERQQRGQTDFSFSATYGLSEKDEKQSKAYYKAAYPEIPQQYCSTVPMGLIIGKHRGKYAYCPIKKDGINGIVVGTPGSGKSVLLLGWLYSMLYREEIAKRGRTKDVARPYNFFIVDIKGELFEKLLHIHSLDYKAEEHEDFHVVAPSVKDSFGWDVFYQIHRENVSETQIIKTITDISESLVVSSGDNPYFSDNARKILSGVLYYYAKQNWDFLPIIQKLMRTDLNDLLLEITTVAQELNMGLVLDKLKGFVGKSDNESLADIETTLKTYLEVFSYPDLQWCLHDNPHRTSPAALNNGRTCLDLAIEESMLVAYQPLFRLITMQVLRHCESDFTERDDRYTALIFDEAARIGNINGLDAAMATLRSKHTALICLFQSISQFRDIYPKEKAQTLLNLCELKIFLSGSGDKDTSDFVSNMAGEYEATKMTYKRKGFFGGKFDGSYSTERRPIVDAKALMELREKGEAIAFIYGHYMRCKKLRYFEDPYLAPILGKKATKT